MARSTFKVLFYVNGSKEKDGIVPIMGRVTINGTVAQFSCKQTIPKTLWDAKGNRAKGKSAEARNVNLALDNIKAQIIKHYQRISDREAYVTAEMVRNAYQGVGSEYETLIKAFDKDCANFLKRVGKDRSIGTYKVMVRARNYVAAFIKSFYRRTDMSMLELTPDFIREFAAYLTAERGLKNATIWLNCMWLKGVVMRAHYNGLIPRNPFAQFHISPNVKEREYLTEDEIKRIMAHEFDNPTLTLVRDLFIFACFTALSFVDMKELTTDGVYTITDDMKAKLAEFYGGYATEAETAATIKKVYESDDYIIDTHTAVAATVYEKYVAETGDKTPTVIASTASPYKFTRSVMNAIDAEYDSKTDFELVDELEKLSGVKVPQAIEDIRSAKVLHDTVCDKEDMLAEVKGFLNI